MAEKLIRIKGVVEIVVAGIFAFKPEVLYGSFVTRQIHGWTGLRLSDASIAPGFNHSIACLVAAVGVGHIVASRAGPAVFPSIFAMSVTWAFLALITCLTPRAWEWSSATLLLSGVNHLLFSFALYCKDPTVVKFGFCKGSGTKEKDS